MARALRGESHWLRVYPDELAGLLYNRLVNAGWPESHLTPIFSSMRPVRLRYPLQHREASERTLIGHSAIVRACAVSADGKRAVSGSEDKTLKVWDLDSGRCLGTVYGNGAFVSLALNRSRLVAGDIAGNVWMLELACFSALWARVTCLGSLSSFTIRR